MIANRDLRKEKCKQAHTIHKPKAEFWMVGGNPEQMGAYMMQKKNKCKKK